MKLATYQNQTRDGQLLVVSRDLSRAVAVPQIAANLQAALDNWAQAEPKLQEVYAALNQGEVAGEFAFDQTRCHSPLPRAYQWADGSAYLNHVELVRKARGAEVPASFYTDPLMYQGGSDAFLPPRAGIPLRDASWGLDFEGEVAVITGDVPLGADAAECAKHIRLLMLVNDVTLRNLIPNELAKGFGFSRRVGRRLARRQSTPAIVGGLQRRLLWQAECRGRNAVQLPAAGGARFENPRAGGWLHRRLRHHFQPRPQCRQLLPGRTAHDRDHR